jgi:hypothetical protein
MSVVTKASQFSLTDTCTLSLQASVVVGVGNSETVISKQQVPVFPALSVTMKQLVTVPTSKTEPEGSPEV